MSQGFLAQELKKAGKKKGVTFFFTFIMLVVLVVICGVLMNSVDMSDETNRQLLSCIILLAVFLLVCLVLGLINTIRVAVSGSHLVLPFKEDTKEIVGNIIDGEVRDGKILVEEYISSFSEGKKPHGERVVLLPSYLLLCNGMGKVTAIPREKIYWLCAQVGRKGSSSFVVRLLIFTEKKTFYMDGVDVEHVEQIADKIYEYIPNVFRDYDPFRLSYELEKLFDQNRQGFLAFYEEEKKKL